MNEYVIWGVTKGDTTETVLYTKAQTERQVIGVMNELEQRHGCTELRVQVVNLAEPYNPAQEFIDATNWR